MTDKRTHTKAPFRNYQFSADESSHGNTVDWSYPEVFLIDIVAFEWQPNKIINQDCNECKAENIEVSPKMKKKFHLWIIYPFKKQTFFLVDCSPKLTINPNCVSEIM